VHDHSSTPGSGVLVRVISCEGDKRTPISSGSSLSCQLPTSALGTSV
jgi:hypothetical protein